MTSPVLVTSSPHHFVQTGDEIWTELAFDYGYWEEMLPYFRQVVVVARVGDSSNIEPSGSWSRADGPRVRFLAIPDFTGPMGAFKTRHCVRNICSEASGMEAAFLIRAGTIGNPIYKALRKRRKSFALQIPGNPKEVSRFLKIKPAFLQPLMPTIGRITHRQWQRQCRDASCVHYVSEAVRSVYPSNNHNTEFVYSNVRLAPEDILDKPFDKSHFETPIRRICSVGRLSPEKGYDVMIEAMAICRDRGMTAWTLEIAGDGPHRNHLEKLTRQRNLTDRVKFIGMLPPGRAVKEHFDGNQMYLLASHTEGMPRSVLEAMSRGLAVIVTAVGGLPDVVHPDSLVPPGDANAFAERLLAVSNSPADQARMSRQSLDAVRPLARPHILEQLGKFMSEVRKLAPEPTPIP